MRKKLLVLFLAYACGSVAAQEYLGIADTVHHIGSAVVTVNRTRVNLLGIDVPVNNLPMTVTTLEGEILQRKAILNLEDAIRFLPGVTVTDQLGAFQRYSIRGTSDAVVAYDGFRDERTLTNTMPFDDLAGIETIEVIKGPASILSGHSVMGGVINIVRKKPSDQFSAYARLGYGSWNQKQSTMGFGGKLAGPVNYYANFHYTNGDGYRKVGSDRISGMFNLGAEVGRTGHLSAGFYMVDNKYRTEIGSAPAMPGDVYTVDKEQLLEKNGLRNPLADYHTTYNDPQNHMRSRAWDTNIQYTQKITEWMNLRNRFGYSFRNTDYAAIENMSYRTSTEAIYDWYYINNKDVKTYVELDSLRSGTPLVFNPESYTYTNNLQLTGKFETGSITHRYTGGWDFSFFDYTNYTGYGTDDVFGPGKNQMVSLHNPQLNRNWWDCKISNATIRRHITSGFYLIDVIDISEKWKAMAGLRYDTYRYRYTSAPITDGRQHYDKENRKDWTKINTSAFTYRAGLVYTPTQPITIYASASNFFKPQNTTYNPNYIYLDKDGKQFYPQYEDGEVYEPEKGYQAELGVRLNVTRILEFNASIFYIDKHNIVKRLGTVDVEEEEAVVTKTVYGQVGREDSRGFDLGFVLRPVSNLQITGGMGWQDKRTRKIFKSQEMEDLYGFTETTGLRATATPRTTAYLYADYTVPQGIFKDLSFHLSATYQDKVYRSIANNTYFPELFLVDAGIYYTIKNDITASININNIFDKEYFTKYTTLGKPANYMLGLTYKFR